MKNTNMKFKELENKMRKAKNRKNLVTEQAVEITVKEATQAVQHLGQTHANFTTVDIIRHIIGGYIKENNVGDASLNSLTGMWLKAHAEEIGIEKIGSIPTYDDNFDTTRSVLWKIA